ncbi:hypothetical protein F3087_39530 [Nocardia colli]|uniref:Uncharacterized protein n=1 Tax=Nocardia colli TaxID=2545717 RepID=A0A5N0E0H0_9NOCA|nr:hypothetical protein [Nocardia colli]KAA8882140.1 hypothetical protein F3087_39530 [Nocardia colli]
MTRDDGDLSRLLSEHRSTMVTIIAVVLATDAAVVIRSVRKAELPITVALVAAAVIIAAATIVVVLDTGNPIHEYAAVFVASAGAIATLIANEHVTAELHAHTSVWTAYTAGSALAMLVLRGRNVLAWAGTAATWFAVVLAAGGEPTAYVQAVVPLVNVAIAAAFAAIMRSLRQLEIESTARAVKQARVDAQNAERKRQLNRLDRRARPMLERIAAAVPFQADEREECRLLEAELRDELRAPQLSTPELLAAARGARQRGVEVMLLDDGGLETAPPLLCTRVRQVATLELDKVQDGHITVRVLPPARRYLATVLVDGQNGNKRIEIDSAGTVTVTLDRIATGRPDDSGVSLPAPDLLTELPPVHSPDA